MYLKIKLSHSSTYVQLLCIRPPRAWHKTASLRPPAWQAGQPYLMPLVTSVMMDWLQGLRGTSSFKTAGLRFPCLQHGPRRFYAVYGTSSTGVNTDQTEKSAFPYWGGEDELEPPHLRLTTPHTKMGWMMAWAPLSALMVKGWPLGGLTTVLRTLGALSASAKLLNPLFSSS